MEDCLLRRKKKQVRETLVKRIQYAIHANVELPRRTAPQVRTGSTHLEVATAEEEVNLDSLGLLELAKRVVDDVQLPMHATLHRDLHGSAR